MDLNNSIYCIDSFKDWLDKDSVPRVYGAESTYYITNGYNYVPRNENFIAYKGELYDIRGCKKIYKKYFELFTFSKIYNYNFTTMPNLILKFKYSLSNISIRYIDYLKKNYETNKLINYIYSNAKNLNPQVDLPFSSKVIKIYIKVKNFDNNVTYENKKIINFNNFIILYDLP
jgi:hypothetical protein